VYIGSSDHVLYALDRATGNKKWEFQTESRITSSPAVAGGVVYFGSFDGNFYAVDAATGKENWRFATPGERRFDPPGEPPRRRHAGDPPPAGKAIYVLLAPYDQPFIDREKLRVIYHGKSTGVVVAVRPDLKPPAAVAP